MINFASYALQNPDIIDNSGLMLLNLLVAVGVKEVAIAGMDGYSVHQGENYYDQQLEYDFSEHAVYRNTLISEELQKVQRMIKLSFITPTYYTL